MRDPHPIPSFGPEIPGTLPQPDPTNRPGFGGLPDDLLRIWPVEPPELIPAEPDWLASAPAYAREIITAGPNEALPPWEPDAAYDLEEARAVIRATITGYLAEPNPTHALAIQAPPGMGKTYLGIRETAEVAYAQGKRVLYAAPRHDFWAEVLKWSEDPTNWYWWQPRQSWVSEDRPETCRHTRQINKWLAKGHEASRFCLGVCGPAYMSHDCGYHRQAREATRQIIMGQHQHVISGHPLTFDVVVIDESPVAAFMRDWRIPADWVLPDGMREDDSMRPIFARLAELSALEDVLSGPALIAELGGADAIEAAAAHVVLDAAMLEMTPHEPEDADIANYRHFLTLAILVLAEARASRGGEYVHRILAGGPDKSLHLLLRRSINDRMPAHRIILDATADRRILTELLGQRVEICAPFTAHQGKIRQVTDRAYGLYSVLTDKAPNHRADQVRLVAERIRSRYTGRVGVVTYQAIEHLFSDFDEVAHFGAARGTNRFDDVDALLVVGTPMPAQTDLLRTTAMVFAARSAPFLAGGKSPWSVAKRWYRYTDPVDGLRRGYHVGGFWADPDLQAMLWQSREAELYQACHRARPLLRPVDIWLFANIPLNELPPTELTTMREIMGTPLGVDIWQWERFRETVDRMADAGSTMSAAAIAAEMGRSYADDVYRYIRLLVHAESERWAIEQRPSRGRPFRVLARI